MWEPSSSGQTKQGWELKWGRDAPIKWDISRKPPCDVYQANFRIVPVSEVAYDKRIAQIRRYVEKNLDADVLAFQEVSGEQAVREILPGNGAAYSLCAFSGFKVQRLVIVWKRSLGVSTDCLVDEALSLPREIEKHQVRPGLSVTLNIDGAQLRIMTVHLKSSCVSPIEAGGANPNRGKLEGPDEACQLLHKQVAPLERWIEARATVPIVLLGDFNRNLAQELNSIPADRVRTDGSAAEISITPGAFVRSLIGEINDGVPSMSQLALLDVACPVNPVSAEFCRRIKTEHISQTELRPLTRSENLGCRNPVGLDHVLISPQLATAAPAEKVPLGRLGGTRPASERFPDPLLAISDHCPILATIRF